MSDLPRVAMVRGVLAASSLYEVMRAVTDITGAAIVYQDRRDFEAEAGRLLSDHEWARVAAVAELDDATAPLLKRFRQDTLKRALSPDATALSVDPIPRHR